MTNIYITSICGELVAEVNGAKCYELSDCIHDAGWGFGESHDIEFDMDDPHNDIWGLIDAIYNHCEM